MFEFRTSNLIQINHIEYMISERINLLLQLGDYLKSQNDEWKQVCELAERRNAWFTQEFIAAAVESICSSYLNQDELISFASFFHTAEDKQNPLNIGVIMAGNIPLVGFHDFLCVYLSGHKVRIKLSSKDDVLLKHLVTKMIEWNPATANQIEFADMLKQCDAYIATGGSQSTSVFKTYFEKYPHIIRSNRTSVAILDGSESDAELLALADDVYQYFGLGCRNVTKLFVPEGYDFERLLTLFRKYDALKDHNKYRNNLDYNLALYIINSSYYMSNDSLLMVEHDSIFSPISVLHYSFYTNLDQVLQQVESNTDIQALVGHGHIPFGEAQKPALMDFADDVNTIEFLNSL